MKALSLITMLLFIFALNSCSPVEESTDTGERAIYQDDLINITYNVNEGINEQDFVFEAIENNWYSLLFANDSMITDFSLTITIGEEEIITTDSSNTLRFQAPKSGTYQCHISFLADTISPPQFSFSVKEFLPLENCDGTWLLVHENKTFYDIEDKKSYSVGYAEELMRIQDHNVIRYNRRHSQEYYEKYIKDQLITPIWSFYQTYNELNKLNYERTGDTLRFFKEFDDGFIEYIYELYHGTPEQLAFRNHDEISGSWYRSKDVLKTNYSYYPDVDIQYSNAGESDRILTFIEDTVWEYSFDGLLVSSYKLSMKSYEYDLFDYDVTTNSAVHIYNYYRGTPGGEYRYGASLIEYKSLPNNELPKEWTTLELPEDVYNLTLDSTGSYWTGTDTLIDEYVSYSDTMTIVNETNKISVFKVSMEEGLDYVFRGSYDHDQLYDLGGKSSQIKCAIFDSGLTFIEGNRSLNHYAYNSGFIAPYSGIFYIGLLDKDTFDGKNVSLDLHFDIYTEKKQ